MNMDEDFLNKNIFFTKWTGIHSKKEYKNRFFSETKQANKKKIMFKFILFLEFKSSHSKI